MEAAMPNSVTQLVSGLAVAVGLAVVGVSAIGNAAVMTSGPESARALSTVEYIPADANPVAAREQLRTVFLDAFNARIR
jgi:hypothetical protein